MLEFDVTIVLLPSLLFARFRSLSLSLALCVLIPFLPSFHLCLLPAFVLFCFLLSMTRRTPCIPCITIYKSFSEARVHPLHRKSGRTGMKMGAYTRLQTLRRTLRPVSLLSNNFWHRTRPNKPVNRTTEAYCWIRYELMIPRCDEFWFNVRN